MSESSSSSLDMHIVLSSTASGGDDLVDGAITIKQSQTLATQRKKREEHRHKDIWIKDPHGGPYRKANPYNGLDPIKQNPDGSEKQVRIVFNLISIACILLILSVIGTTMQAELGYHNVETGPTSNFVGNHMTQGAIDLVQYRLGHNPRSIVFKAIQSTLPVYHRIASSVMAHATAAAANDAAEGEKTSSDSVMESSSLSSMVMVDEKAVMCIDSRAAEEEHLVTMRKALRAARRGNE